jgi:hypothetical protein
MHVLATAGPDVQWAAEQAGIAAPFTTARGEAIMASQDPWSGVSDEARRTAERARLETARSGLYNASVSGQLFGEPERKWAKGALLLLALGWGFAALQSLPAAVAGLEVILGLALLKNWFGLRSRLPILNSERSGVAAAGWIVLLVVAGGLLWAVSR